MTSHSVKAKQACAVALAAALWVAAAADAGALDRGGGGLLTIDPLSAVKPASRGKGPSFLSVVVGRSDQEQVERALGTPTGVDMAQGMSLWRGTAQCKLCGLGGIAVHYGEDKVVDWMELVLQRLESIATVERALRLGERTFQRRQHNWVIYSYGPACVHLVLEAGNVGTLRLVAPHAPGGQPPPDGPETGKTDPLAPIRLGTERLPPCYGQIRLLRTTRREAEALLGGRGRAQGRSNTWWDKGALCEARGLERVGITWENGVVDRDQIDLATRMAREDVVSRLRLGRPTTQKRLNAGRSIEFYDPQGVALGIEEGQVFAVMLIADYVESIPDELDDDDDVGLLAAVKVAAGSGPSFLSVEVGHSGQQEVRRVLGRPTQIDEDRDVAWWRATEQCERHGLSGIGIHYGGDDAVDRIELVPRRPEGVAKIERALRLGAPTATRRDGRQTVQSYGAAGVELILDGGRVAAMRLVAPRGGGKQLDGKGPALLAAAARGDMRAARVLLENGADPNARDDKRMTPLHLAAMLGHGRVVALLLAEGADPKARGAGDLTPLHVASLRGHADMAREILSRGADVNATDEQGRTPLHLAAMHDRGRAVEALIENKAAIHAQDRAGVRAQEMASAPAIARYLLEMSRRQPDASGQAVRALLDSLLDALRRGDRQRLARLLPSDEVRQLPAAVRPLPFTARVKKLRAGVREAEAHVILKFAGQARSAEVLLVATFADAAGSGEWRVHRLERRSHWVEERR